MHQALQTVCNDLDELSTEIKKYTTSESRTFMEIYGWNQPAIPQNLMYEVPLFISQKIKNASNITLDATQLEQLKKISFSISLLKINSIPSYFGSGNVSQAMPVLMFTMNWVDSVIDSIVGWQAVGGNKAIPMQLARRLRSIEDDLSELTPKKEELRQQIKLIHDATEAAETLPTDLHNLKEARNKVDAFATQSAEMNGKIDSYVKEAIKAAESLKQQVTEANRIVAQCEEAYRVTTSKGLAAAFDERATSSNQSMYGWVAGLIAALALGAWIGTHRIEILTAALNQKQPDWSIIWVQISLSALSIGAPLWFAWLSTKQINQRFRLSEDYAYKASISKAYEGYRREAARIDEVMEARLFATALTRLEEAPLRLVETDHHGSPWHELFASTPFQKAIDQIPGFKDAFVKTAKEATSILKPQPSKVLTDKVDDE